MQPRRKRGDAMSEIKSGVPITTDVRGVMQLFGIGRNKAREIGEQAGAVIRISSRRTLYSVERIKNYLEQQAGNGQN